MPKNDRLIDGFYFETDSLYEEAHKEQLACAYLSRQVDLTDNNQALRVYQQAISQNIFSTVIGFTFLKKIEERLKKDQSIPREMIVPIPVKMKEAAVLAKEPDSADPPKEKKKAKEKEIKARPSRKFDEKSEAGKFRRRFHGALSIIVILLITIGVMFFITLSSELPTIVNYRTKITNEYSSWEEELKEREASLDLREKQLMEAETGR